MPITNDHQLARALLGEWSDYIPHNPSPKQLAFMMLPHREALFGGRPRCGKSDCLLADALRHVDVPNYSAIIFRLTLTDLEQPEGLLQRAHEWLDGFPEVRYIPRIHAFKWPNGATLTFGYIGSVSAWMHYQGGAYQFIGWDELTQHSPWDYGEMFSRNSRLQCPFHGGRVIEGESAPLPEDPDCRDCQRYAPLSKVPLRVRSTTNPGGPGHMWVKERFKIKKDKETGLWLSTDPDRPFLPATYHDNPYIDQVSYKRSLEEIADPERRQQLIHGDWDSTALCRFKSQWFRLRHRYINGYYQLLDADGRGVKSHYEANLRIFCVVDVACSVREGVGGVSFHRAQGKELPASWSVIGTFGITPSNELLILDVQRFQEESPHLYEELKNVCRKWAPLYVALETNGPGKPIAQMAMQMGVPIHEVVTYYDKISNATQAQVRCKAGKVYLPEEAMWVDKFLGEILTWTGHPHEPNDQVDVLSNSAHEMTRISGNMDRDMTIHSHLSERPQIAKMNLTGLHNPDPALSAMMNEIDSHKRW